jgi:hypothetical protein
MKNNPFLKLVEKKKDEVNQKPFGLPITGTKKEFPGYRTEYCFGMEYICPECCKQYGHWDGTEEWKKGKCCWCEKETQIIDSFYAGFPDNIKPPEPKQPNIGLIEFK